jgi:hypothetical protein
LLKPILPEISFGKKSWSTQFPTTLIRHRLAQQHYDKKSLHTHFSLINDSNSWPSLSVSPGILINKKAINSFDFW